MRLCIESITKFTEQCDRTLNQNYERVRVEDKLGRQEVNWDFYKQLDQYGQTLLVTAMEEDELAGFVLYTRFVHPHHPDGMVGACAFLIVHPKHRGKQLASQMISFAEIELKKRGCTHIIHNRRMVYDVEPLFPKLGFEKIEESYIKELK